MTADELESMDTLAETRRRLLEKERSSYWAQFRAGLLSARAVAQLDNNLSEFLDQQGKIPMNQREYLERVCGVSKFTEAVRDWPFFKKVFFRTRLRSVTTHQRLLSSPSKRWPKWLIPWLRNWMTVVIRKLLKSSRQLKDEIRQNRLKGLEFIRNMHENYPEATVGIETKDAIRSVLNHERNTIKKLRSEGMLETDEAARMITAVEERMKSVMESSMELRLPEPEEVLREVNWLKGLPEDLITKIINASETSLSIMVIP